MRPLRFAAVALIATAGLLLAGCSSSDEPSTSDPGTSQSPGSDAAVSDFADVDGFTLVDLPEAARQAFAAATQNAPQIEGFDGRMVEKDGEPVGMVMRVALDPEQAKLPNFEKQFLPGFASGIAGADAKPEFEEINGTKVVKIAAPGGNGTAYAWIREAMATVLVFQTPTDAATYSQGALAADQ